tara:strand:+ start:226 stop:420 length:195 start_codon:yes stop_codon:yes gene_type:complete
MNAHVLFLSSLLDGSVMPWIYYDNREAAEAHRDHINKAIAKNNPMQAGEAFVRMVRLQSTFGEK